MEILPLEGVGKARFGMKPAEVLEAIAEEQKYEDWMGGNLNDSLLFHGLILGFSECSASGPLPESAFMEVRMREREDAVLFGRLFSDWTINSFGEELRSRGIVSCLSPNGDLAVESLSIECWVGNNGRLCGLEMWWPWSAWPEEARERHNQLMRRFGSR